MLAALEAPPQTLGVTHWSSRLVADQFGISHVTVAEVWKKRGLQPWWVETFKFSTDPELEAKVRDVVGLYLHPPENAIVLCCDEKSQIQALDRTGDLNREGAGGAQGEGVEAGEDRHAALESGPPR